MAASVLLGARVIGAADQSVPVWAASKNLVASDAIAAGDALATNIRFVNPKDAQRYLSAREALPEGRTLNVDVKAGELIPRSALEETAGATAADVLAVEFASASVLPQGLKAGDRVDIFVTAAAGGGSDPTDTSTDSANSGNSSEELKPAAKVLEDVPVLGVSSSEGGLSGNAGTAVNLAVPLPEGASGEQLASSLALVVQGAAESRIYLVKAG